jgi:putative spermidine/putrescine transport system substrate-binding protein
MRASGFSSRVSRRRLLQLGAVAGAGLVAACRRGTAPPQLHAARGLLPKPWSEQLPSPWTWSWQEAETTDRDDQDRDDQERVGGDLLALNDGWLQGLPPDQLQRIQAPPLEQRLGAQAQRLLALQGELLAGKVLPVGVSPWVMLFRNGAAWAEAARAGWDVLLQPSLRGRVILPASPRWVIDLADRCGGRSTLRRLRQQLLTMDDRRATNWLLKDKARVVVLPLQRCMPLLRRDPRLTAVLPAQGAPLHWTLLVRPKETREPLPQAWVDAAWTSPLRRKLLLNGWRAPLEADAMELDRQDLPKPWRDLLLPPASRWERCWSLPPLMEEERLVLQDRWRASAP